ncbi:MAG: ABC transporter permease, partial [Bifidobacterium crudilactis]|nr:ABC transporter permease [Bifidobacterium crudilactis]
IGVSGLGTLLTDGFQRGIMAEVVTGVVATMLLAVIVDGLILGLGRLLTPWRRNRKTSGAGSEER